MDNVKRSIFVAWVTWLSWSNNKYVGDNKVLNEHNKYWFYKKKRKFELITKLKIAILYQSINLLHMSSNKLHGKSETM